MAIRWGVNLPGPFFMSWGRSPRERRARTAVPKLTLTYIIVQIILWATFGALWVAWTLLVLTIWLIRYLIGLARDAKRGAGRHNAEHPVLGPNVLSDRR